MPARTHPFQVLANQARQEDVQCTLARNVDKLGSCRFSPVRKRRSESLGQTLRKSGVKVVPRAASASSLGLPMGGKELKQFLRTTASYRKIPTAPLSRSSPGPRGAGPTQGHAPPDELGETACAERTRKLDTRKLSRPHDSKFCQPAGMVRSRGAAGRRNGSSARREGMTAFRRYYDRGDIPISVDHVVGGIQTRWHCAIDRLDYKVFLPIFFDGMRETEDPYRFLAIHGAIDMIERNPNRVRTVIPQIILPIKSAIVTKREPTIRPILRVIQLMLRLNPNIGPILVPYYRQLLPGLRTLLSTPPHDPRKERENVAKLNLQGLIMETLECMERAGGADAYFMLKYMIPTYESCI